jgi:transposase
MMQAVIVGIDLGKNWFHLVGVDDTGAAVLRKKMNRSQFAHFAATAPKCIVATSSRLAS